MAGASRVINKPEFAPPEIAMVAPTWLARAFAHFGPPRRSQSVIARGRALTGP
jgi:hypothetical protein